MKTTSLILFFFLYALSSSGQRKDTFEVYFPFNNARINKEAEDRIDRMVFNDSLIHGDKLIVLGYTDYVGGNTFNDSLSRARAKSVSDYLVKAGFTQDDISLCIGKGKIDRNIVSAKGGFAPDRKVQIIIDHTPPKVVDKPVAVKPVATKKVAPKPVAAVVKPEEKIDITNLEVNQAFALNHINFEPGLPVILENSKPDLEKLYEFLYENENVKIQIEGHVCCVGPIEGTDSPFEIGFLSDYRSQAIARYLVERGINAKRLRAVGLGNRNPIVKVEETEEDKVKNRRVEIRILSK